MPDIDAWCYALEDKELQRFMGLLSRSAESSKALDLGVYTLDPKATAYVDGDKFFQRHAALLALPSHRKQSNLGLCGYFMAGLGVLSYMK